MNLLEVRDVRFAYGGNGPKAQEVLSGVSFDLAEGEFLGLVGPNGSGKSTLLKIVLGLLKPAGGEVRLSGAPVASLSRRAIARRASFLPQGVRSDFAFSVRQIVAMGRTPWLGWFSPPAQTDRSAVAEAIRMTRTEPLSERSITALSGGERQRVFLARAFAQESPLLVLDEPSANLDLLHAFQLVELVRRRVAGGSLAALHDLNLAARFCDRILALSAGRVAALGTPEEVLTPERLRAIFGVETRVLADGSGRLSVSVLGPAVS